MRKTGSALLVLFVLLAATASTAEGRTEEREHPGRALFERAEAAFNRGKFEEARASYQAAYDVEPLPAFLFNIAQCYRNLGDYERAQFFFHRYTVLDPNSPNRAAAERLIAEMNRLAEERRSQAAPVTSPPSSAPSPAAPPAAIPPDGRSATEQPSLLAARASNESSPPKPVYRRGWFWAGVGGAVLLGATAAVFALSGNEPEGTLPPIDAR
jgi:tetratricopeptide (TPR) repeat protein